MKKLTFFGMLALYLAFLVACSTGQEDKKSDGNKITVMTTFYPMYEFTKEIVGDKGNVEMMIPAGTEPHDFEPTAKDIAKIQESKALVYDSNAMEGWVEDVKKTSSKDVHFIEAAKNIPLMTMSEEEEDHEGEEAGHDEEHEHGLDPHVWLSPKLAQTLVSTISQELSKVYPDDKETFEKNAAQYIAKLQQLDADYNKALSNAKQKDLVTQHAAFGYLAHEYGLNQVPISGLSPDEEPSPSRLAELKEYVKNNHISLIYFEETASDKIAKTLANEAHVKLEVLNPLESLTKEQMDKGENYISVMKENLEALKKTIK